MALAEPRINRTKKALSREGEGWMRVYGAGGFPPSQSPPTPTHNPPGRGRSKKMAPGEDEGVGAGRGGLDRAERVVVHVDELPELREVLAHQREVVPVVQLADLQDPVASVAVAELGSQGIAGVGRVGDQLVVAERLDDLADQPRLRVVGVDVDEAGHRVRPSGRRGGRGGAPAGGRR